MQKYAKHFLGVIGGSGLAIAGAIIWHFIANSLNYDRILNSNGPNSTIFTEIGRNQMWPFAIIGTILLGIGVFFIIIPICNLLTRE